MPRSLSRAARKMGTTGEPLPSSLKVLDDLGFVQRRGQLSLLIAAPGNGKSLMALHAVLNAAIPTLYVSADTDRSDQAERATCILAGVGIDEVKQDPEKYLPVLDTIPADIMFEFDSAPTAKHLIEMVDAYRMVHGHYPHLIVVDTIGKVWSDIGEETARNKEAVENCQNLARYTGAHVMACHHATKSFDKGDVPIPLDGLMSGTSKIPEQVISVWREGERMAVAVVKNRSGPADPTGARVRGYMDIDFSRAEIQAHKQAAIEWRYDEDEELL